jgi:hypothetical protein
MMAVIGAFFPMARALLPAIGALKSDGELYGFIHAATLRPILSDTYR